jgi:hypothetical protein
MFLEVCIDFYRLLREDGFDAVLDNQFSAGMVEVVVKVLADLDASLHTFLTHLVLDGLQLSVSEALHAGLRFSGRTRLKTGTVLQPISWGMVTLWSKTIFMMGSLVQGWVYLPVTGPARVASTGMFFSHALGFRRSLTWIPGPVLAAMDHDG